MDRQFEHFAAYAAAASLRIGGVLPAFANVASELVEIKPSARIFYLLNYYLFAIFDERAHNDIPKSLRDAGVLFVSNYLIIISSMSLAFGVHGHTVWFGHTVE